MAFEKEYRYDDSPPTPPTPEAPANPPADNPAPDAGNAPPAPPPESTPTPPTPSAPSMDNLTDLPTFDETFASPSRMGRLPHPSRKTLLYAAAAIIIVIVVGFGVITLASQMPSQVTTTTISPSNITNSTSTTIASTTVPSTLFGPISACGAITSPGTYYLSKNITVSGVAGPCISIQTSNVAINGQGKGIQGNGPFIITASPSYGIIAANVSNVTLQDLSVSKFSYGVYFSRVNGSNIVMVSATNDTLSDIFLINSSDNLIAHDNVYSAESTAGGLYIQGGSDNNVSFSNIMYNAYYGLYLNSSGNRFVRDTFGSNHVDLLCSVNANSRDSNNFSSSGCQVSNFCNFAQCKTTNLPYNFNNTALPLEVNSCGSIANIGTYTLSGNLALSNFVNSSNPLSSHSPCIVVSAPDVKLNCANNTISNAYYGVFVTGLYNTSVENCNFANDTYGLYLKGTIGTNVGNVRAHGGVYGVYLNGTTGVLLSGISTHNNVFGLYSEASSGTSYYGLNSTGNSYGLYVDGSGGNQYYTGTSLSNSNADLYCSATSYNSTQNLVQKFTCGSTDCQWAFGSCVQQLGAPLAVTRLTQCGTIFSAGAYVIAGNITVPGSNTCFTIVSNDITLNCNNNPIGGLGEGYGTAISISRVSNVTVKNCRINGFEYGVYSDNASYLTLQNLNISGVSYGVYQLNGTYGTLIDNVVNTFNQEGFLFKGVNNTIIANNTAKNGVTNTTGYSFANSHRNDISGNLAQNTNPHGFIFNSSRNNTIQDNNAEGIAQQAYYCDPATSGLYAEQGGVNSGVGKVGCIWMVELNPSVYQNCASITSSSSVILSQDLLYTFGSTCYTVSSNNESSGNNTVIDCAGHTVFSNSGGSFVGVGNADNVQVENCYLKNFTTAIYSSGGSGTTVINNTITNSRTAVSILGNYGRVQDNQITNASYGIAVGDSQAGTAIDNNNVTNTNISIELTGVSDWTMNGNRASHGRIGAYLINATIGIFQNNILLNQTQDGLLCTQGSGSNSSLNIDQNGGNYCSVNSGCDWVTQSPLCRSS